MQVKELYAMLMLHVKTLLPNGSECEDSFK